MGVLSNGTNLLRLPITKFAMGRRLEITGSTQRLPDNACGPTEPRTGSIRTHLLSSRDTFFSWRVIRGAIVKGFTSNALTIPEGLDIHSWSNLHFSRWYARLSYYRNLDCHELRNCRKVYLTPMIDVASPPFCPSSPSTPSWSVSDVSAPTFSE